MRRVDSSWNVMAHGDAREGKWRRSCRMECVASTLHTTSEHCVSSITTADTNTLAASNQLNWRPSRFKWSRPFRRRTKSVFCACAITFYPASTSWLLMRQYHTYALMVCRGTTFCIYRSLHCSKFKWMCHLYFWLCPSSLFFVGSVQISVREFELWTLLRFQIVS